jgi:hypothetical protein
MTWSLAGSLEIKASWDKDWFSGFRRGVVIFSFVWFVALPGLVWLEYESALTRKREDVKRKANGARTFLTCTFINL